MQENMSLARKTLIWVAAILAILGYGFQPAANYALKHLGVDLSSAANFVHYIQPYSFLLLVLSIATWYTPYSGWRRIALAIFYVAALAAVVFDINLGFTLSFKALMFSILGIVLMVTLPKLVLWKKVVIGLIIGIFLGFDLKVMHVQQFSEYLKIFGTTFIDLIMMIVVPLIFFALVSGVNNMTGSALGRVGIKAVAIYMLSAMFAIALGLIVASILNPGRGVDLTALTSGGAAGKFELPKLMQILLHIIPHNALGAMAGAEGKPETVQTVFIAIFVGVTLNLMGEQGKRVVEFCNSAAQLMFKMIGYIIKLAPLGVFGLMSWITSTLGMDAIFQLAGLVLCTIFGMMLHLVILALMLLILGRLNPIPFFMKSIAYQTLAFSTSSSKATLATAMTIAEEKIGVSKPSTSFVLPLGAAINMDGTAIYLGICAIFFAQAFGIELHLHHYILIIFTATIASVGAAGYPGGSIVMMPMVLDAIGVAPESITLGIALIAGVDRILDMFRTTVNVTSDVALTTIIDRSEGTFNETLYNMSNEEIEGIYTRQNY